MDVMELTNYDKVKERLFICVCNGKEKEGFLKNVPNMKIEDMAVTCHILVNKGERGIVSATVTNNMLKLYGISKDQLFDDALKSSPKVNPPKIENIQEMLEEVCHEQFVMMGFSEEEIPKMTKEVVSCAEFPMIVVTNEDRVNGASTIFYPGIMDELGDRLKSSFFVLPSSLHEMIVVPDTGNAGFETLLFIVKEVNATQVDAQDKLTDQVYHYDVTDRVFEKASDYADRER